MLHLVCEEQRVWLISCPSHGNPRRCPCCGVYSARAGGSTQTSEVLLLTSVTDLEMAHHPRTSWIQPKQNNDKQVWVMVEKGQKSKRSNFNKMKAHAHIEDGSPQPTRGPCRLTEGHLQLLDPQAP